MKQTKPAQAMELRSLSPVFDGQTEAMAGMAEIPAEVVEATWKDVASFSDSRGQTETQRAHREQPHLFEFVLASTEHLSPPVHGLAFYIFLVIWQAFRRAAAGKLPRITAGAIERRLEQNEQGLSRLAGADARFLERVAAVQTSSEPAVFRYVVEALMEAPDDPDDPIMMTEEESGALFLVLQVAVDVLHDAREKMASRRTRG